jgi:DNA polymerase I
MTVALFDLSSAICPHYFRHGEYSPHSTSESTVRDVRILARTYGSDGVAICCDVPYTPESKPTWRHKLYGGYKATRKYWPQKLVDEHERTKAVLAEDFPVFAVEGYEGEDLIATIAAKLWDQPVRFVVISGDKDVMQMVCPRVRVYNPRGKTCKMFDSAAVAATYKVMPAQIRLWLALAGDSTDGIPGVKGIGDKTAVALLSEYDTLDKVIRAPLHDTSGSKVLQAIARDTAQMQLSYKLAGLNKEVKEVPIEDIVRVLRRRVA